VPWCVQKLQCNVADMKKLPVPADNGGVANLCFRWANHNGRAGFPAQVHMTTHKIGMKMRFEHIFDTGAPIFCQLQIRFHIAQRIDHGGFAIALNIIGCFSQAFGIKLLNEHKVAILIQT
jgi:hypothetical protein